MKKEVEKRWCHGCKETKELTPENWAWADKEHTKFRIKCRKCTNFASKMSHRIHYEERKQRYLEKNEISPKYKKKYVLYKGDEYIGEGTIEELVQLTGLSRATIDKAKKSYILTEIEE